jgi:hypothetical protein
MVDTFQPRSLSCFRIRKRRHENRMDLRRANTPVPLNMTWAGERSQQARPLQSPVMFFLLTLPFIERAWEKRKMRHVINFGGALGNTFGAESRGRPVGRRQIYVLDFRSA